METPTAPKPNILVVDDTPANLQLLVGMLQEGGYRVRPVTNGAHALKAVQCLPPDLILLDVNMPEMDGYEVCRQLKADPATAEIPVLFISAHAETQDKVRAFQAGGVDYVTKPFQIEEVEARVRTHLELRRQKRELAASLAQLQEVERLRDSLTHMMAHDMKSPLLAIQLSFDFLAPYIPKTDTVSAEVWRDARASAVTIVEMIEQMLDVSRLEAGALQPKLARGDLVAFVHQAVEAQRTLAGRRRLEFSAAGPFLVEFDAGLIRRVVGNLVGNAIKFTATDGEIRVSIGSQNGIARVEVTDNGRGIAAEQHQKIFEKFGQVEHGGPRTGTGLGLTFARMAVEAHGGEIGVVSAVGKGSTFWFTLPAGSAG